MYTEYCAKCFYMHLLIKLSQILCGNTYFRAEEIEAGRC